MAARFFLLNTSSMKRRTRALLSSVDIQCYPFYVPSTPIAGWFITSPRGDHSTRTSHLHHVGQLCYPTLITIRSSCSSPVWNRAAPVEQLVIFQVTASAARSTSTVPCPPLTRTQSPVCRRIVALPQPTTTGIPSSRATIAACDNGVPTSVTTAAARGNRGVQPTLVTVVTRISPGCS